MYIYILFTQHVPDLGLQSSVNVLNETIVTLLRSAMSVVNKNLFMHHARIYFARKCHNNLCALSHKGCDAQSIIMHEGRGLERDSWGKKFPQLCVSQLARHEIYISMLTVFVFFS
jgi:hypothetical protein